MPKSFAERYMEGIFGGLDIKRSEQQMKIGDLRNRLLEEEIADIHEGRKRRKSLFDMVSKLDPGLQESIQLKEGFKGMPWEATPFGQEQKTAEQQTPGRILERKKDQSGLSQIAGQEMLPGIMGAFGKDRFVKEVGKPQLGTSMLEELGVVPKMGKAKAGKTMTADERAQAYMRIPEGKRTEFQNRFLEEKYFAKKGKAEGVYPPPIEKKRDQATAILKEMDAKKFELSPGEEVLAEGAKAYLDSTMDKYGAEGFVSDREIPYQTFGEPAEFYGATSIAQLEKALDSDLEIMADETGRRSRILDAARKAGLR